MMKNKLVILLSLISLLAAACTPLNQTVAPAPSKSPLPTVTPLGAGAPPAEPTTASPLTTPVSPLSTPAAPQPAPASPVATPAAQSSETESLRPTPGGSTRVLNVLTHDAFALSDKVLQQFETANNAQVHFIKQGDAGQALARAILTKDTPEADVLFGVDNTFMGRALSANILEQYRPAGLLYVPREYQLDPDYYLTPIDYGDVCLNYDKAYFAQKNLQPPQTLADLTKPEYKNLLVVENPADSSPGLAFMLATISTFGADQWLDYWKQLKANGVKIVEDWNTAYSTEFSGSSGKGPRPIVVSYASSPPAEVVFANPPINEAPTAAVTAPQTCFRQVEFAGILKGTQNRDLAEKWIEFMLSVPYQEDLPLNQFVYPVNPAAQLPAAFTQWSTIAEQPANLTPDVIAKNRDRWIDEWTNQVLH